ncbi:MAG: hypothetical protein ACOYNC_06705 [Bacteroidales bacterium]
MITRSFILALLFVLSWDFCLAQKNPDSFRFFGVRAYSGELMLRGFYRDREQISDRLNEKQKSYYYSGGISLNASTYILHPNFCELELGAAYMPESNRDNFLAAPDQAEVRTLKKLNLNSSFFNRKKITFMVTANYDESFARRENLTNIRTTNKYIGGSLIYSNKYIPVTIDFYKRKLVQTEIQTKRVLRIDQVQFNARAEQSFTASDRQVFTYSHKKFSNLNENNYFTENSVDDFNFNSSFGLGEKKVFTFNTTISEIYQYGSYDFNRFTARENLVIKLPANFMFFAGYSYYNIRQPLNKLVQHTSVNSLNHKLFKSLDSRLFFEYSTVKHTVYSEYNSKTGFDFNYVKKIPWGDLHLSYEYFRYHQDYTSDSVNLIIANEDYQLSDSKITLLKRPYINLQSVIVKDISGTILYLAGVDYILIERGKYFEIRRIPSGLIANGGTVYIDYTARQSGSYKYDADNHAFAANVALLKGRVDLYYRLSLQRYKNLENTDYIALNYFTQNVVGVRLGFGLISGGAEYEDYRSSIMPYHMVKYYLNLQKTFKGRLNLAINGNMQNYTMLNEPDARLQRYTDLSGKIEYLIVNQTKVNLDIIYRKQQGRGIDLDLLTSRLELSSVIYQLYVTAGIEVYRRLYIGEKLNFKGVYLQLIRKF